MTTLTRFPLLTHATAAPTSFLIRTSGSKSRSAGAGASFWFRSLGTVLSEVPLQDLEVPLLVRARTADVQDVTVSGAIGYRFTDPVVAASRIDFRLDAKGRWSAEPLRIVSDRLASSAQQYAVDAAAQVDLATLMRTGITTMRAAISEGLSAERSLSGLGLELIGVRVVAIRPDEDLERDLQAPVREQVQAEAARAGYERRAQAVEQERAIEENELHNKIELSRRRQELIEQDGANSLRTAELGQQTDALEVEKEVNRARQTGDAEAARMAALAAVLSGQDTAVALALTAPRVLANLPRIDSLTVTPDQVTQLLGRLVAGQQGTAGAAGAARTAEARS
ncbi:MAG: SPFH domain-containing protein [Acidipropionibacterium sp.]|jgi:hypothetical protein|nr:SPFH domain-containing protein [Acidipropionibacterium sp.]